MFKTNEYFDGKVKSISFTSDKGAASIGVMDTGEYEFGTSTVEIMTVTSGVLTVQLQGFNDWDDYGQGESFTVAKDSSFKVKCETQVSYLCLYC